MKKLVLVCGKDFHSNKPLRIVRVMLPGRRGCKGISEIRIPNPGPGAL